MVLRKKNMKKGWKGVKNKNEEKEGGRSEKANKNWKLGRNEQGRGEKEKNFYGFSTDILICLLYTSPSPRDRTRSRMPSSA